MPKNSGVGDSANTAVAGSYGPHAGPPPGGRKRDPRGAPQKLQGQSAKHPKHGDSKKKQSPLAG